MIFRSITSGQKRLMLRLRCRNTSQENIKAGEIGEIAMFNCWMRTIMRLYKIPFRPVDPEDQKPDINRLLWDRCNGAGDYRVWLRWQGDNR